MAVRPGQMFENPRTGERGVVRIAPAASNVHLLVDVRPAFVHNDLDRFVDSYTLPFEHGMQEPDPAFFALATARLGVKPAEAVMVGDRVEERLHHVLDLVSGQQT